MKVVFECVVPDGAGGMIVLNDKVFSSKFAAGYCLGMSIDWAKTTLTLGEVKTLDMLHPGEWPIIQSAYESKANFGGGPDAISAMEASGLTVTNSDGEYKGNEIQFNRDYGVLAQILAGKTGTYIIYLGGPPGGGGHFMGFRRKGTSTFIMAEWFDPGDCLMRINSDKEWRGYIQEMLTYCYSDSPTSKKDFREYCCIAQVEKTIIPSSSMTPTEAVGMGKDQFAAARNVFNRRMARP